MQLIITCNLELSNCTMYVTRLMHLVTSHPLLTHVDRDSMGRVSGLDLF